MVIDVLSAFVIVDAEGWSGTEAALACKLIDSDPDSIAFTAIILNS